MNHLESDAMNIMNVLNYNLNPQSREGEKKSRRRRKKAKAEEGESKKRKLTDEQVKLLEISFGKERKLDSCRKMSLASELKLDPKQVAVWFQNRRARWKIKQLEEEYAQIKSQLDAALMEKCRFENENMRIKRELEEAREQLQMLSIESSKGGSPSSSSTENFHPSFGEFGVSNDLMYMNDQYNYIMDYYLL